jgi:hypothetical protein
MAEKRHRSFYSNALDEAERIELKSAVALEGIDDEIAVMRIRIKKLLKFADVEELTRCTNALCRMLITRYAIEGKSKKSLKVALGNVLRDVALPLGFNRNEVSISLLKK